MVGLRHVLAVRTARHEGPAIGERDERRHRACARQAVRPRPAGLPRMPELRRIAGAVLDPAGLLVARCEDLAVPEQGELRVLAASGERSRLHPSIRSGRGGATLGGVAVALGDGLVNQRQRRLATVRARGSAAGRSRPSSRPTEGGTALRGAAVSPARRGRLPAGAARGVPPQPVIRSITLRVASRYWVIAYLPDAPCVTRRPAAAMRSAVEARRTSRRDL